MDTSTSGFDKLENKGWLIDSNSLNLVKVR